MAVAHLNFRSAIIRQAGRVCKRAKQEPNQIHWFVKSTGKTFASTGNCTEYTALCALCDPARLCCCWAYKDRTMVLIGFSASSNQKHESIEATLRLSTVAGVHRDELCPGLAIITHRQLGALCSVLLTMAQIQ